MKYPTKKIILDVLYKNQTKFALTQGEQCMGIDSENFSDVAEDILTAILEQNNFKASATPLISYMAKHLHPHHTAIVTSTGAELLEGKKSTGEILDFIVD